MGRVLPRETFSSLANRNFRRYFTGQAVSLVGTWIQMVAQSWLVLQLTGSGSALGGVVAVQTLPMLLLGPYGGVVADRFDKRRLMIVLQAMMGVLALVLGVLALTHRVTLWQVYVIALLLGLNNCFENPARQAFVLEMVAPDEVRNAVSLNSVLINAARAIGPGIAGLIIAVSGVGVCFLINAASFAAVIASLITLDLAALHRAPRTPRARGQVRAGLAYVRRTPELATPLLMMAVIGCLAYEFQVVLPVLAQDSFGARPQVYGFMTAAMGAGAVVGGLFVAARGGTGNRAVVVSAAQLGVAMAAAALAPGLWTELLALLLVGGVSVGFLSKGSSTLQLAASPVMRGRVLALWTVAFLGSTPIGGPVVGWVGERFGGRVALGLGAAACLVAAGLGAVVSARRSSAGAAVPAGAGGAKQIDRMVSSAADRVPRIPPREV
jgi:MFS family permease